MMKLLLNFQEMLQISKSVGEEIITISNSGVNQWQHNKDQLEEGKIEVTPREQKNGACH